MRTFLTSDAMNPALRARVERAVSAGERARVNAKSLGLAAPFARQTKLGRVWLVPVILALALGAFAFASYRSERRAVAAERFTLQAALDDRRALLPRHADQFLAKVHGWVTDAATLDPTADVVAPAIRGRAALDAWLTRPAVYVRMTANEARDAGSFDDAVRGSTKDAFLLCLLHPPASDSEKDRLAKVRGVYFDGAKVDEETANVRRLASALLGLRAVGPSLDASLGAADDLPTLHKLRRDLDAAPVADAARAARAELLMVVIDEPGAGRVVLADLTDGAPLVRLRRPLTEPGNSPAATLHRDHLAACSLALATRAAAENAEH